MGVKLEKYFKEIESAGGVVFTVRLAMKTGIPSNKAPLVPDDPVTITKFKNAFKEITGKDAPEV